MAKTERKKRNDGNYALQVKVAPYKTKSGKISHFKTFYGKTLKEAKEKRDRYLSGADTTPEFFDDLMNAFIENTFLQDPRYKDSTKSGYLNSYRNYFEPLDITRKPIKDITFEVLQEAYNSMACGASGVKNCHKLLRIFFALMVQQKRIDVDPTEAVVLPKAKKKSDKVVTFTDSELAKVRNYINRKDLPTCEQKRVDRFGLIIHIAMDTGCRIGEILGLTYDDVNQDSITITKQLVEKPLFKDGNSSGYELVIDDTKTDNSIRTVPIKKALYDAIQVQKRQHFKEMAASGYRSDLIFTTSAGKPIDKHDLRRSIDRIHKAAGVPQYGLHTYRRTFGTRLAAKGVPIQVLCSLLGHENISTTAQYYIGITDKQKKHAINKL